MEIIPGILEKDWLEIEKKLNLAKLFARTVHIDIIDGKFINNTTFLDPQPFKKYSNDLFLELHMMVDNPTNYIEKFAQAGFKRFLGHVEKLPDQSDFLTKGRIFGEVGLALDGPTPLSAIKVPFDQLDCVLIFTSDHIGFSGNKLKQEKLEKIKKIRQQSSTIPIEVDGGINKDNILSVKKAGATRFSSTGFIFKSENPAAQYERLLELVSE